MCCSSVSTWFLIVPMLYLLVLISRVILLHHTCNIVGNVLMRMGLEPGAHLS